MTHVALIIDDEADIRELIAMSLDRIGLETHTAANLEEARNLLANYKFDVCLTDMKLPDGNGVEFVKYVLTVQPDLPVAVFTAHGNMDAAVDAMKNGAFDFVSKPVDLQLLRSLITEAVGKSTAPEPTASLSAINHNNTKQFNTESLEAGKTNEKKKNEYPEQSITGRAQSSDTTYLIGEDMLIGDSVPMKDLKNMILKVARTNAPVWITGESGTGKELIAHLIHDNGPRAGAPFVAINCGAIPSELMESEMFGHRKGSFTGAHSDQEGLFQRAEGGTLFLDEVAELPLHMQVKLLRAIQERSVRPVGSSHEITTNVRILSASHKDLAKEVKEARFRHDLYYRLNVICIRSPSLRHRRDDVVMIARHILETIARTERMNKIATLTTEAEDLLRTYSFPGNVRELENILERAVALSDNHRLAASDLNLQLDIPTYPVVMKQLSNDNAANDPDERQMILDMLNQTRWNRKATAENLGLTYRQLRYRIKQYEIEVNNNINKGN